jgi:transposase
MWAPKGQQPQVLSAPTNQKIGYFGAVNSSAGELFTETNHPFNGETFELFLTNFLAAKGRDEIKIVMVLDNASWHKQAVKNLEAQFPNSFKALFLPPYSPDLNPIERLWRLTRRCCTHNKYFDCLEILKNVVEAFFSKFAGANETLARLCAIS